MARIQFSEALPFPQAWHKLRRKNKTELSSCKWRECGLPWHRKTRQMRIEMLIQRIRSTHAALLPALSMRGIGLKRGLDVVQ